MSRLRALAVPSVLVVLLALSAGCSVESPSAFSSRSASAAPPRNVVVLGDSQSASPPHDCDGCTSYLDRFASSLQASSGDRVVVYDDAVDDSQLADVAQHVEGDQVVGDLRHADVVIVWIGYNDGPPYNRDTPCASDPGDTAEQQASAVEAYTADCITATMALYRERYAALFDRVAELSPDAASRLAVNTVDNWAGNPAFASAAFPAERMSPLLDRVAGIFDAWNAMQCEAATASGFRCVDVYHALNGADGRAALGDSVSDDYTHLSQKGHDAVAELLTAAAAR